MKSFMTFLNEAVTPYHSVLLAKEMLKSAGFEELSMGEPWSFVAPKSQAYFTSPTDGTLFAWVIPAGYQAGDAFRLAAAHTDYPCLHIKPSAEVNGEYCLLNTEVYGGPILNTWLDRPLGIAGRVMIENADGGIRTEFIKSDRSLVTIPNLPIHFNREVNKGIELSRQVDMRPLAGTKLSEGWLQAYLAKECGVMPEQILESDLYLFQTEPACVTGWDAELISSPRLDNQTSCYALIRAVIERAKQQKEGGLCVISLYDNEEVGSKTRQGADSALAQMLLEKLYDAFGFCTVRLHEAVMKSRCLSLDVAHALHPNHPERYDAKNTAKLSDGVVLKLSSTQKYAYEPLAVAEALRLCKAKGIPVCRHTNHSDQPGGSTMGPLMASWLPMPTIDAGVPIMAMHSARELMSWKDEEAMISFAQAFLEA